LTGENSDGNGEVFLLDAATGVFTQVTRTEGSSGGAFAAISDAGIKVAFVSSANLTGSNPSGNQEIFLAACARVNDLVSLAALPDTFETTADSAGCPVGFLGRFSFVGRLTSLAGSPQLTNLQAQVQTLTNGNVLQNADSEPAGVGAAFTVAMTDSYADGVLGPGEVVDVPFVICLRDLSPFQFFVEVLGKLP
jgi:hypothetical protein